MSLAPVPLTAADPPIHQWSALSMPDGSTPAGGAGLDPETARSAAVGELLERFCGATCDMEVTHDPPSEVRLVEVADFSLHSPEQRMTSGFPHAAAYHQPAYTRAWNLLDNSPVYVPAGLVSVSGRWGHLATSSGLAAGLTMMQALLRATQEIVERDALVITWQHCISPPQVMTDLPLADAIGAECCVLDITPDYSPHPVAMVMGSAPVDGTMRHGAGVACRASWSDAVAKAEAEWAQSMTFVTSEIGEQDGSGPVGPPTSFDEHALYYSRRPERWRELPALAGPRTSRLPTDGLSPPTEGVPWQRDAAELHALATHLDAHGIELFYRDLSVPDATVCGIKAVRVLSPQLVGIHPDHRWPFLGGTAPQWEFRYPGAQPGRFPSPFPHPLG